jgi:hypothetical protein
LEPRNETVVAALNDKQVHMNIKMAHDKLGHMGEELKRQIAKALGWVITRGTLGMCQDCVEAKAKKKSVLQKTDGPTSTADKHCYFLDLSTLKDDVTNKRLRWVWHIMVEQLTQLKYIYFYQSKNGMVEPTVEKMHQLIDQGIGPYYL